MANNFLLTIFNNKYKFKCDYWQWVDKGPLDMDTVRIC